MNGEYILVVVFNLKVVNKEQVSSSRIEVTEESNTAAGYQYSIYIAT